VLLKLLLNHQVQRNKETDRERSQQPKSQKNQYNKDRGGQRRDVRGRISRPVP
jgi:hypothetical protein